jgi:hypothetical protein
MKIEQPKLGTLLISSWAARVDAPKVEPSPPASFERHCPLRTTQTCPSCNQRSATAPTTGGPMQRSVRRYALLPFAFVVSALACHGTSEPEPTSEWTSIAGKLISVTSNSQTGESRLLLGDYKCVASRTSCNTRRVAILRATGRHSQTGSDRPIRCGVTGNCNDLYKNRGHDPAAIRRDLGCIGAVDQ